MSEAERVRTLRRTYWQNGFRPIAVWSPGACDRAGQPVAGAGKRPLGEDWRARAMRDPPDAVNASVVSFALNTGILGVEAVGVDVDVTLQWLADSVVHRIEHMLNPTPLVRIGRAPKTLLVYRVEVPIAKMSTPELYLPDGTKMQVEVLASGQHFVADGIHPDTGQPYHWTGASPADVKVDALPVVDEEMIRDMLDEVERVLREAGAAEKEKPTEEPSPRRTSSPRNGSDFFRNVNSAALGNIEAWVLQLFPKAKFQKATRAWRVSSKDLSRSLEEDISIHPGGIRDFGEEEPQTAIDLVLDHGNAADATAAALWLCEQLGIDPASLGWRAKASVTPAADPDPAPEEPPKKPEPEEDDPEPAIARKAIRVDGGDLGPATKAALTALTMEPNPFAALYVRDRRIVFPVRLRSRLGTGGIRRPDRALALLGADRDVVALRLTRVATFHKSTKKGPPREVDPPERVCNTVLAATPWDGIPRLVGTIEAPTVLPNGALVQEPGYHAVSGLLLDSGSTRFPKIPERPTRADALAALEFLQKPLEMFPFVTEADRSVALSATLTALVRRGLRAAPLIAYSAPKPASGKTLLASLPAYIVTGRGPYVMPPVTDAREEQKRLLAALSECPAVIVIDNIERPFRSSAMCIVLTEPEFTDRVLGLTENRSAETNCCFFATGNNLVLAGDLASRGLRCEIDPDCERPDAREFEINLHQWVPANRGQLVTAGLTIILAYLADNAPAQKLPNFARFEQWQRLCRFPLTWLGLADPCVTTENIRAADPVQTTLTALLAAWHGCFGDHPETVKQAVKKTDHADEESPEAALREAIEAVAAEKDGVNGRQLGNFISRFERRIEGGLRFERVGEAGHAVRWRSKKMS